MATTVSKTETKGREVWWKGKLVRVVQDGKVTAEFKLQSEKQAQKFFFAMAEMKP